MDSELLLELARQNFAAGQLGDRIKKIDVSQPLVLRLQQAISIELPIPQGG